MVPVVAPMFQLGRINGFRDK